MRLSILLFFVVVVINVSFDVGDGGDGSDRFDIIALYRRYLVNLINRLDTSIDPCHNFFEHVCNGGGRKIDDEKSSEIYWNNGEGNEVAAKATDNNDENVPPFLYNEEDRMRFFQEKLYDFRTLPGEILRDLYLDCKDRGHHSQTEAAAAAVASEKHSQWMRILNEVDFLSRRSFIYRQWPFMQSEWSALARRYRLNWVILEAKLAAHGLSSLLRIFFAENTIYIETAIKSTDCLTLEEYEKSLLTVVGERRRSTIGWELYNFCNILTGVREPDFDLKYNDTTRIEQIFFQTFFTTLELSEKQVDEARHIPIDLAELQRMLTLLLNANPRIVFNYVLWHAHASALMKYDDCYALTNEFEDMLFSEYWQWHVLSSHSPFDRRRDVAIATYLYQTTRFQQRRKRILMSNDWDKFFHRKLVRRDFNIERLIRNYSAEYLDTDYLMSFYGKASLVRGHFYGNLLSLRRMKLRQTFSQPFFDDENLNHAQYFLRQFLYSSILLTKQPFFHYFATQGFDLWYQSNLLYTTDGYLTVLDCLVQQTMTHILGEKEEEESHNEFERNIYSFLRPHESQEIYRFGAAFLQSYRDYRFWLSGTEFFGYAEEIVLEYFQFTSQQIQFYATAQLYCNRNDPLYSSMINRSFMNFDEFAVAFNCSENSPMHPSAKCMNFS